MKRAQAGGCNFEAVFALCGRAIALDRGFLGSYSSGLESGLAFSTERSKIMSWETPSFVEIDMSAEIGSYQGEDDNGL